MNTTSTEVTKYDSFWSNDNQSEKPSDMTPRVDVIDGQSEITLYADMPGVSKKSMAVHVENHVLTVEGTLDFPLHNRMKPLFNEISSNRYFRSFTLSKELDTDKIIAEIKDGVLKLTIPRSEAFKARKIAIEST